MNQKINKIIQELASSNDFQFENNLEFSNFYNGKTVLITGAAGSIGSELTKRLSLLNCKNLVLLDISESALYDLQQELYSSKVNNFQVVICDVRNKSRLDYIFSVQKPNIVFHAAAYKHVPLMEQNPYESISANVFGTCNTASLSFKYDVEKFVLISSDKAVNPTNIMGATKRIAELCVNQNKYFNSKTSFITTRFGNIIDSSGSVIPLFKKQIEKREPVTLTHIDITRYFMSIPIASNLILNSAIIGKNQETLVFDMGKPVKILDIAKAMISLAKLEYPNDINIEITGLRPGEKMHEELVFNYEVLEPTSVKGIKRIKSTNQQNEASIQKILELYSISPDLSRDLIVAKIKEIVPEFNQ